MAQASSRRERKVSPEVVRGKSCAQTIPNRKRTCARAFVKKKEEEGEGARSKEEDNSRSPSLAVRKRSRTEGGEKSLSWRSRFGRFPFLLFFWHPSCFAIVRALVVFLLRVKGSKCSSPSSFIRFLGALASFLATQDSKDVWTRGMRSTNGGRSSWKYGRTDPFVWERSVHRTRF